jgi:hypothetical protein
VETASRKRREKKVFMIDFVGGESVDPKKLFAKGTPATLNLPKDKKGSPSLLVLPVDVHFSSKELTKLFTKPMWAVGLLLCRPQNAASLNPLFLFFLFFFLPFSLFLCPAQFQELVFKVSHRTWRGGCC